jgi:hypothetical protein
LARYRRDPPVTVTVHRYPSTRLRNGERPGGTGFSGLVTFMRYDLGYFDDETCRLEPIENPFVLKLLPMSPE